MNLFQLIADIAKADPEVYDRFDSRRAAFRHFLGFGQKVSAAALPLAVSTLFNKAYGQTAALTPAIAATLNLALQLEYLEFYYYDTALKSVGLLSSEQVAAFTIIRGDEQLHINTLKAVLGTLAVPEPGRAGFDYSGAQAGRRAPLFASLGASFTSTAEFLTVAQYFEDTGVRAYKGAAPSLMPQKDLLEAALNIHSVEARHSARIRLFRRGGGQSSTAPKSWITPDETPATPPLPNNGVAGTPATVGPYNAGSPATTFPAESNTTQGSAPGISVLALVGSASTTAGAEAFDEPLDAATVQAIAKNFAANPAALFN